VLAKTLGGELVEKHMSEVKEQADAIVAHLTGEPNPLLAGYRDDGPAAVYPDGRRIWFIEGEKVREERSAPAESCFDMAHLG
jgi:hypothetical protein